jgi:hypothetical protein
MSDRAWMFTTILVIIAIVDLALFSTITILTVLAFIIGALGITLGNRYSYKSASVLGLLITGTAAAASMDFSTVLEAGPLLATISGLMIPMFVLTWAAVMPGVNMIPGGSHARRGIVLSVFYAGIVLASEPVASFFLSLLLPSITTGFNTVSEVAIVLVVLAATAIFLTRARKTPGGSGTA